MADARAIAPLDAEPADLLVHGGLLHVVITPSDLSGAWSSAVEAAASAADRDVLVVHDAETLPEGLTPDLVVISRPVTAASTNDLGLSEASRLLARAVSGTCSLAPMITDISSGDAQPVPTESPFFRLQTPAIGTDPAGQPGDPLAVYADGMPTVGVRTQWNVSIFTLDAKAKTNIDHVEIDLAGRARYLIHGPYLWLPPGLWRVRMEFGADSGAVDRRFRAEWGAPAGFAELAFSPSAPGRYQIELEHEFIEAAPTELRLVLTESVLSGLLHVYAIDVELVATVAPGTADRPH